MSYKYSTEWYKKRKIIIFCAVLIVAVLLIIGGGVLLGFGEVLKPFNVLWIGIPMIIVGAFTFFVMGIFTIIEAVD